jgi:pimeloyl-ACP methyl ester carboxylesterase
MNLPNAKYAFKSTLQNSTNTQLNLNLGSLLSEVPTLIIWGTEDNVIPLEHSELFREYIKNSKVILSQWL